MYKKEMSIDVSINREGLQMSQSMPIKPTRKEITLTNGEILWHCPLSKKEWGGPVTGCGGKDGGSLAMGGGCLGLLAGILVHVHVGCMDPPGALGRCLHMILRLMINNALSDVDVGVLSSRRKLIG